MRPTRHDPRRTLVTWGPVPIRGYAPGTFVTASRIAPIWRTIEGTQGEMRRMRRSSTAGVVEVTVRQTSEANRVLGILAKWDETSGTIIMPLAVTDTLNGGLHYSGSAYIERYADASYGQTEGNTTWTFRCDELDNTYPGLSVEVLAQRIG